MSAVSLLMNHITELTKSLITFQSIHSRPDEIKRCADFICDYLAENTIDFRRYEFGQTPSILVAPQKRHPRILLMAHFDVVDGPVYAFQPFVQNGALFGRGSLDDKYAVALSLVLVKAFIEDYRKKGLEQEDIPLGILLTGDEEAGGENGANKILPFVKPEFCIALDGGSVDELITKEKGIAQLKLVSKGKSAHGSRPWLGENAIDRLIADYHRIKELFDMNTPDNWHRTLNLSRIHAGSSFNQVPGLAEAVFDIRYTENDDINQLIDLIRQSIQSELLVIRKEPLFIAQPSPYLDLLLEINPDLRTTSEHGSSDARFLSMHGINGVVWGANGDLSHHSEKEHVNIDSVFALYQKLSRFIYKSSEIN